MPASTSPTASAPTPPGKPISSMASASQAPPFSTSGPTSIVVATFRSTTSLLQAALAPASSESSSRVSSS